MNKKVRKSNLPDFFIYDAFLLRLTTKTPAKTMKAARTFCHVSMSMPMIILITVAIIGCI